MMKQIIVETCNGCPYSDLEIHDFRAPFPKIINRCKQTGKKINDHNYPCFDGMPDWCPLQDVKEE